MPGPERSIGVIGAGIVGVLTALRLQREGHTVWLLDPEPPGSQAAASFGNAGCFNPSSVVPMSMPGVVRKVPGWLADPLGPLALRWNYLPTIAPWLIRYIRAGRIDRVEAQARALGGLLGPCLDILLPMVREADAADLVRREGILVAYRSEESRRGDDLSWELRRRNGIAFHDLNADELRQFDPALSRDFIRAVHVPDNGHTIDPGQLVARLADAFIREGGVIHRRRATGFELQDGRLRAVRTPEGELPANAAIIAAGAHSRQLAAAVGDRVPLETERGYHLMIRDAPAMPRVPTTDADGKFVATPMSGGLRFAGTVELAGLSAAPNWRRARMLLEQGRRMLPGLDGAITDDRISMWMGHRPSLPDSLPVIGRSTATPDVFHAFGHGHVGMTGAPGTSLVLADLIASRPPSIDIAPFRPDRFG